MLAESKVYDANKAGIAALINHYDLVVQTAPQTIGAVQANGLISLQKDVNWAGVFSKFVASVTDLVVRAEGTEEDRRAAVQKAAVEFYVQVGRPILAAEVGRPVLFNNFVEPMAERAVAGLAGSLYDALSAVIARFTGTEPPAPTTAAFQPY